MPVNRLHNRYTNAWEYIFIVSKGRPKTFNPIKEKCRYAGEKTWGRRGTYKRDGEIRKTKTKNIAETKIASNIFAYRVGNTNIQHPAIFPYQLAEDMILTYSFPGDWIVDPFCGSGTTGAAAIRHARYFVGIDIERKYTELARKRIKNEARKDTR